MRKIKIELPCEVGDIVWAVIGDCVRKCTVESITVSIWKKVSTRYDIKFEAADPFTRGKMRSFTRQAVIDEPRNSLYYVAYMTQEEAKRALEEQGPDGEKY